MDKKWEPITPMPEIIFTLDELEMMAGDSEFGIPEWREFIRCKTEEVIAAWVEQEMDAILAEANATKETLDAVL